MESWVIALLAGVGSGLVSAAGFGYWYGRNTIPVADFKELEKTVQNDRHTARSNLDARAMIFQEKVEGIRDRYDAAIERIHGAENRLTRIEAKQNGAVHK